MHDIVNIKYNINTTVSGEFLALAQIQVKALSSWGCLVILVSLNYISWNLYVSLSFTGGVYNFYSCTTMPNCAYMYVKKKIMVKREHVQERTSIFYFIIVLDMFLSNKSYEAAESDEFLQVSICVNKKIGRHNEVPVCITAETVEMANQSGIPLPATILADNPYSPSKAGVC